MGKLKNLETKELQAQLKGLVYKILAQQFAGSDDMGKYENLITELARRNVSPKYWIEPRPHPQSK